MASVRTHRLRGVEEEKTQDLTTSSKVSLPTGSTIHGELAVGAHPRAVPGLPPLARLWPGSGQDPGLGVWPVGGHRY